MQPEWIKCYKVNTLEEPLFYYIEQNTHMIIYNNSSKGTFKSRGSWIIAFTCRNYDIMDYNSMFGQSNKINSFRAEICKIVTLTLFFQDYSKYLSNK